MKSQLIFAFISYELLFLIGLPGMKYILETVIENEPKLHKGTQLAIDDSML